MLNGLKYRLMLELLSSKPKTQLIQFTDPQKRVAKEFSVDVKTKNTFKYDYFPGFLLCLKNA